MPRLFPSDLTPEQLARRITEAALSGNAGRIARLRRQCPDLLPSLSAAHLLDKPLPKRPGSAALAMPPVYALTVAANRGETEVVRELLAAGASPEVLEAGLLSPLHIAATKGYPTIARLLLEAGANPNPPSRDTAPLGVAFSHKRACGLVTFLPETSSTRNASDRQQDYQAVAKLLLNAGADPNTTVPCARQSCPSNRMPVLLQAIYGHDLPAITALLDAGANPNMPDTEGWFPLTSAAEEKAMGVVDILLRHGANPWVKHNGATVMDILTRAPGSRLESLPETATLLMQAILAPQWWQGRRLDEVQKAWEFIPVSLRPQGEKQLKELMRFINNQSAAALPRNAGGASFKGPQL